MKRRWWILLGFLLLLGVLWQRGRQAHKIEGAAMGCQWTLLWRGEENRGPEIQAEIAQTLEYWEQVMSTWRKDSDLSRYNRGEAATIPLQAVLAVAEEVKKSSGGAFDPYLLG